MSKQGEPAAEDAVETFDSVLAGAKPVTKSCRISLRGDIVAEIEDLELDLEDALARDRLENRLPQAPEIARRIVELTDEAHRHEKSFVFRSLGRRAWRDLVAEHPARDEDREAGADYNRESLPAAAMAAACTAPSGATLGHFELLRDSDTVGDVQWNRLWQTCHEANLGGSDIPLSVAAFVVARGTGSSSESPALTESPAASS